MSSLLQHHKGLERDGKVEILFYLVEKTEKWEKYNGPNSYNPSPKSTTFAEDKEPVELRNKIVPQLYKIRRKPIGMFGCWVVFRWNNEEHVPDLSIPVRTFKLPKDAIKLSMEEMEKYWFENK